MSLSEGGISLTIVTHEDIHLSLAKLRDGWGDAYQKRAAVIRLSSADTKRLGLEHNSIVELSNSAGSVVVTARPDATCEEGIGFMPSSLYTNRLASYDPASSILPGRYIQARVAPTDKEITPILDLIVRRNVA